MTKTQESGLQDRSTATDAMSCQKDIAVKIVKKRADYVLLLKDNQPNLYEDVKLYFEDAELLEKCSYHKNG